MTNRILVLLLLLLPLPSHAKSTDATHTPAPSAPGFTLPTRDGTVALDSLRGKVVLLDFWASWCEPCKKSFPWMASLQQRYAPHGLAIVAIDLDKDRAAADRFLSELPAPFTVAFDPSGKTAEAYRVSGMPSSFLVSRAGAILYAHVGFDSRKTAPLEALIQEACP